MKKSIFILIVSILSLSLFADPSGQGPSGPTEEHRGEKSDFTAFYLPTIFSDNGFNLYDNFSFSGSFENLIKEGPNLGFYYGYTHSIKASEIVPDDAVEVVSYTEELSSRDVVSLNGVFTFFNFFKWDTLVELSMNRMVSVNSSYNDYNYDRLKVGQTLSFDGRYSSLEPWVVGSTFKYPEKGTFLSAGFTYNYVKQTRLSTDYSFFTANGAFQQLFQLSEYLVLSLEAAGESVLNSGSSRINALSTNTIGAYDLYGDWVGAGNLELRFLQPVGVFIETPSIFYLNSFIFKLSPGVLLGYNAGITGRYGSEAVHFQQSGYISPMIALRMSGALSMVLRFDFAIASSYNHVAVFSINWGSLGSKPGPLFRHNF